LITHNETILTAINLNNRLDNRVDILKQAVEKEELEHKDMKQNSAVITVTEENNDDSERSESDNGESEATESDSTTTDDDTAEQDSRVF
jgi:hypothetical protein